MAQLWPQTQADQRTFGAQQQRTLDDLNRPNLQGVVTSYLQDSMRFWQRKPFFFTSADNTDPLAWQANVYATQGCTIQYLSSNGTTYAFVAANAGMTDPATQPNFEAIVNQTFAVPPQSAIPPRTLPPPPPGTPGTLQDNQITWLNNGPILGGFRRNTQLSTVYAINQYVVPIDLVAFTRIEVTWANTNRNELAPLSYGELRNLDVVGPSPPTTYPTAYAYYHGQVYLWPYPIGQYPLTLSYRSAPVLATQATDVNIWTTTAEAMVRHYAEGRINEVVVGDQAMAQMCYDLANQEFLDLQQQTSQRDVRAGIPPSDW